MSGKFTDQVLKRYARAQAARDLFNPLLKDCYDLALPGVDPTGGQPVKGGKADAHLYDDTMANSVHTRRNRMHGQMFPLDRYVIRFAFATLDVDSLTQEQKEQAEKAIDRAEKACQRAIENSNFHLELPSALDDVLVSTGCLMVDRGTTSKPLRFQAVPISEVVPEEGVWGGLETLFRRRKMERWKIQELWPDAGLPKDFENKLVDDPDALIDVVEAQLHNPERDGKPENWDYKVFLLEGEACIIQENWKTKRLIGFRLNRYAGEAMGRGPVTRARAFAKTANKVVELTLKNGTIAVTGIWQADDDGVLNLANIKLVPGTIIPKAVGSKGLTPLETGARFDVSQLILADQRRSIQMAIEGPEQPGYDADRPVAAAYYKAEQDRADVEIPENQRLYWELDDPLGKAILDILSDNYFQGTKYHIDPALTLEGKAKLVPTPANPITQLREQTEVNRTKQGLLSAMAIDAETTARLVNRTVVMRRLLLADGLKPDELYDDKELKQQADDAQAQIEAQTQAALAGAGAGAQMQQALAGGNIKDAVDATQQLMGGTP